MDTILGEAISDSDNIKDVAGQSKLNIKTEKMFDERFCRQTKKKQKEFLDNDEDTLKLFKGSLNKNVAESQEVLDFIKKNKIELKEIKLQVANSLIKKWEKLLKEVELLKKDNKNLEILKEKELALFETYKTIKELEGLLLPEVSIIKDEKSPEQKEKEKKDKKDITNIVLDIITRQDFNCESAKKLCTMIAGGDEETFLALLYITGLKKVSNDKFQRTITSDSNVPGRKIDIFDFDINKIVNIFYLHIENGNPRIRMKEKEDLSERSLNAKDNNNRKVGRAYFSSHRNTMFINKPGIVLDQKGTKHDLSYDWRAELTHAKQLKYYGYLQYWNMSYNESKKAGYKSFLWWDNLNNKDVWDKMESSYEEPGTIEHRAHSMIEPNLVKKMNEPAISDVNLVKKIVILEEETLVNNPPHDLEQWEKRIKKTNNGESVISDEKVIINSLIKDICFFFGNKTEIGSYGLFKMIINFNAILPINIKKIFESSIHIILESTILDRNLDISQKIEYIISAGEDIYKYEDIIDSILEKEVNMLDKKNVKVFESLLILLVHYGKRSPMSGVNTTVHLPKSSISASNFIINSSVQDFDNILKSFVNLKSDTPYLVLFFETLKKELPRNSDHYIKILEVSKNFYEKNNIKYGDIKNILNEF